MTSLVFLRPRSLPPPSGNILVDRGDAFISSEVVENELFALPVPAELATLHPEATALGRLLYEMACGAFSSRASFRTQ